MRLFFILPLLGCLAGGFFLVVGIFFSSGAPQQGAAGAIAAACAVIPYCFARSIEKLDSKS